MFVKSVLTLNKNENAEKNPLCVYEDTNTSKIKRVGLPYVTKPWVYWQTNVIYLGIL